MWGRNRLARQLALAGVLGLLLGATAPTQMAVLGQTAQQNRSVRFKTSDGVNLAGTFYPASRNAPCVLLLHQLGKGHYSHQAGWEHLAEVLQKKGFSVLSFDFRGHGQSTTLAEPEKFWAIPINRQLVKATPGVTDLINVTHFNSSYYPYLVNDIAAAKSYLDRQNDANECNSSALVVIGAEAGATLGAIWINSEWHRYKVLPPDIQTAFVHCAPEPEGKNILAAAWLSISPKLGTRPVPLASVLKTAGASKRIPLLFYCGEADKKGIKEAEKLVKELKVYSGRQLKFTGSVIVPKSGNASGQELLQPSLGTAESLALWLSNIVKDAPPEWRNQDFMKSRYIWGTPGPLGQLLLGRFVTAKEPDEEVLRWYDYLQFAR